MKQIMLVDDESDLRLSIKIALDNLYKNEISVISAENGEKCINILKQGTIPDIILLDIMMPNMSGWEVYDKIRDNPDWKNIPILFLTARTDRIAENAGKYLGDDFIEKPVEVKELRERINRVLDR
jgi:CheY-like chemotaxis protein